MNRSNLWLSFLACGLVASPPVQASSADPLTPSERVEAAAAVFRGTVVDLEAFEKAAEGPVYTRAFIRVEEVFKGKLPALVKVVSRGGSLPGRGEAVGSAPQLSRGEERLWFVSERADGSLCPIEGQSGAVLLRSGSNILLQPPTLGTTLLQELRARARSGVLPGADLSAQASRLPLSAPPPAGPPPPPPSSTATNLMTDANNIAARFIVPDRGDPILYYVDADYLPTGMSQAQALSAVATALGAWTNTTSVRYAFAGLQSFGQASPDVVIRDGALRIQLHDHYSYLAGGGGEILGEGGREWLLPGLPSTGWTAGGNVRGNDFYATARGYVVLQHANPAMQNLATFTEVLTHEIGHTLGVGHSSIDPNETNPLLKQAIMYYAVHADGRGATLNDWDVNVSNQVHPRTDTPPFGFDRFMDIVTSPVRPLNIPGVNTIQLRGYDLQHTPIVLTVTDATSTSGTFSVLNGSVVFVPSGFFSGPRQDPASGASYDQLYARWSDGLNASPFVVVRVISLNPDSYNEGIPDAWRTTYFGNASPSVGINHHAADDLDGDGFSNLQEYWLGSNPTDKTSNLRITSITPTAFQWQAKPYEVYEVFSSTNLTAWTRTLSTKAPTNTVGTLTRFNNSPKEFFRVVKVP